VELVSICNSVICCRVNPTIKAKIVQLMQNYTQEVCLAIGDGANDVSMIQQASIGVGLIGLEGTQAARSADYAIYRFHHLQRLLAVHGRYSLIRNSALFHYSIYKNAAFALGQYWFAFFCGFSGQRIYNDWMMLFFNIFFTSVPTVFVAIFEKDLREDVLMAVPEAYQELKRGHLLNYKTTFWWFFNAVWHSLVIYFVVYIIFQNDVIWDSGKTAGLWSLGYYVQTFAVLVVLLKLALETKHWVIVTHIGIWGSIVCYFIVLWTQSLTYTLFAPEYFVFENASKSFNFVLMLFLILSICFTYDITIIWIHRNFFVLHSYILQEKCLFSSRHNAQPSTEKSPLLQLSTINV